MYALSVQGLTKIYGNKLTALKAIDLEVAEGDFFALLGPNGAGKSTTIGIVSSLIKKTSGKVFVFGHNLDTELAKAKSLIGIVPQEINFNPFEKMTQILINQAGYYGIPKKMAEQKMEIYLKEMNLWEMRNQQAFKLSGGMKRRLMIVRALMTEPKLLILDEPTAGVDIELRHILWNLLKKINEQGITIILTTHYLEEAEQLCKHVAIINHGTIIKQGNMKKLLSRLNVHTIMLDVDQSLPSEIQLSGFNHKIVDAMTLEIILEQGQSINQLFNLLSQQNINIVSLRNKTNRLEELFIYLISQNKSGE